MTTNVIDNNKINIKKNSAQKNINTNDFINKIKVIYVPIHGISKFNNLFESLNDYHLLNMINIYQNVVFEREQLIKKYLIREQFIKCTDYKFASKIYVNAIQNYLY